METCNLASLANYIIALFSDIISLMTTKFILQNHEQIFSNSRIEKWRHYETSLHITTATLEQER